MEARFLNPEKEFNKLFKELNLDEEEKQPPAGNELAGVQLSKKARQRLERHRQAMANDRRHAATKTLLPKSDLPRNAIPRIFSMQPGKPDSSGHTVFTYEESEEYAMVQKRFLDAQRSNNIGQLYEFLQVYSFHPECLLIISEFSRLKGSFVESTKLLERCLSVFECTWNYSFAPLKNPPNTRLDFKNSKLCQVFGEALFRYIDILGRRGCSRTALEYCKLVLSLCPENDPYGILLILDFYAIRASEYKALKDFALGQFVKEFYKPKEKFQSLLLAPNMLYSCALADKMMSMSPTPTETQLGEDFAKMFSLKDINKIVGLGENAALMLGIILYPSLLKHMIKKLKGAGGTSWDGVLGKLKKLNKGKKYYADYSWICKEYSTETARKTLKKIYSIYNEKGGTCFTSDAVQSWMRAVANFILDGVLAGELDLNLIRSEIIERTTCPFYLERYSYLNVIDYKDDLATIPQEELNPVIENTLFAPAPVVSQSQPAAQQPNLLAAFFRSLFD
eukprot:TRINITY_DN9596_c0_g1_i9.p1 TRINITY_DN9596_c0_g1~~TRINITY_DN9596_c0_g1_i9.p1  ORF type:complete len:507 (+),score=94.68 TRINITY_DN9596_c0_g1_i9:612-2132(+)